MNINRPYSHINELPETLPVFPLSGVILFPRTQLPLNIFEPRYMQMLDDAMRSDRLIGIAQPMGEGENPKDALNQIGAVGRITHLSETGDGRYSVVLTGVIRFRIIRETPSQRLYREFRVNYAEFECDLKKDIDARFDRAELMKSLRVFAKTRNMKLDWAGVESAPDETLVNAISMMSPLSHSAKQRLLEAKSLSERSAVLIAMTEIELIKTSVGPSALQ